MGKPKRTVENIQPLIMDLLERHEQGVNSSVIICAFRGTKAPQIREALENMVRGGHITAQLVGTKGRPALFIRLA